MAGLQQLATLLDNQPILYLTLILQHALHSLAWVHACHSSMHAWLHSHTCTHYLGRPSNSCSHLDARLTFRIADSMGILQVCNAEGQWSTECAQSINPTTASIACNQLGFDGDFDLERLPIDQILTSGGPVSFQLSRNVLLICSGSEHNLSSCIIVEPMTPARRKRISVDAINGCRSVALIGCRSKRGNVQLIIAFHIMQPQLAMCVYNL